jgi:S1-C subfamily serine protease
VRDVDHNGLAYRVGVREGDRLIEVNGEPVTGVRGVYAAWRKPVDNRILVTLERDGRELEIDERLPEIERFVVPVAPWREHR